VPGTNGLDIHAEARKAGILPDYFDARGEHRQVPDEALRRVLEALPEPPSDLAAQAIVHRAGSGLIQVQPGRDGVSRWRVVAGDTIIREGEYAGDGISLPDEFTVGVYRLELLDHVGRLCAARTLLVTPPKAFQGEFDRVWVLAVQLYNLRSQRNWGIGDFTDLKNLIRFASMHGCAGIGLNPLHALFPDQPETCSPYAPNSRLFLNPVYIDVEAIPEFFAVDEDTRNGIAHERQRGLIDYKSVMRWKLKALHGAFESLKADQTGERATRFAAFRRERGVLLQRFATFEVLRGRFNRPWWEWPDEYRRPNEAFDGSDDAGAEFVEYLQWLAHTQLQECADLSKALGLKVGLYLDVAVGVRADGFDAWLEQDAVSRELSVGAPPDLLNTAGQDWGLCGFNGPGLASRGFEPFRMMIEASARYAGAIRLDHVLGLGRLFLVPSGFSPKDGAYVTMPLDALLAIAAMESQARRCIIIGEDLGTVPDGFREKMADWGIWSYLVMLFEREYDGGFKRPDQYAPNALVTFNTHDLSSFAGWRGMHDLRVKRALGIDPGEGDDERHRAITAFDQALAANGIAAAGFTGAIDFLSRTRTRLLSIALDDILAVVDQINVPGTIDQHPNWRRRLPVAIDDLGACFQASNIAAALAQRSGPSAR
jgi:4-alpha-glucanotransferase